jgi:hypothetical protein
MSRIILTVHKSSEYLQRNLHLDIIIFYFYIFLYLYLIFGWTDFSLHIYHQISSIWSFQFSQNAVHQPFRLPPLVDCCGGQRQQFNQGSYRQESLQGDGKSNQAC